MLNIGISSDTLIIREGFGVDSLDDEAGVSWRFLDDDTVVRVVAQVETLIILPLCK